MFSIFHFEFGIGCISISLIKEGNHCSSENAVKDDFPSAKQKPDVPTTGASLMVIQRYHIDFCFTMQSRLCAPFFGNYCIIRSLLFSHSLPLSPSCVSFIKSTKHYYKTKTKKWVDKKWRIWYLYCVAPLGLQRLLLLTLNILM